MAHLVYFGLNCNEGTYRTKVQSRPYIGLVRHTDSGALDQTHSRCSFCQGPSGTAQRLLLMHSAYGDIISESRGTSCPSASKASFEQPGFLQPLVVQTYAKLAGIKLLVRGQFVMQRWIFTSTWSVSVLDQGKPTRGLVAEGGLTLQHGANVGPLALVGRDDADLHCCGWGCRCFSKLLIFPFCRARCLAFHLHGPYKTGAPY